MRQYCCGLEGHRLGSQICWIFDTFTGQVRWGVNRPPWTGIGIFWNSAQKKALTLGGLFFSWKCCDQLCLSGITCCGHAWSNRSASIACSSADFAIVAPRSAIVSSTELQVLAYSMRAWLEPVDRRLSVSLICFDNRSTAKALSLAAAKYKISEMFSKVVDECLQLHGGYGYMLEYPIARAYLDNRANRIYAGTNEIMKELISRSL